MKKCLINVLWFWWKRVLARLPATSGLGQEREKSVDILQPPHNTPEELEIFLTSCRKEDVGLHVGTCTYIGMNSLALNRKSIPIEYRGIFPIYYAPRSSLVVITCSKKSPERVQSAAEYSPIISKHRTPKIHGICSRQKQTSSREKWNQTVVWQKRYFHRIKVRLFR